MISHIADGLKACTRRAHVVLAAALYVLCLAGEVQAADLPVACTAGACGAGGPGTLVTSGSATPSLNGQRLTITQATDKAVLNWAEFNVAAGNTVNFAQPGASSLAINRIFQDSPSRIFGVLTANGQVYLLNQNGILFGKGAQVNVGSLVASSLPLDDRALANGILDPGLLRLGKAAFAGDGRAFVLDQNGQPVTDASGQPIPVRVVVEEGAVLRSDPKGGGRLMLVGQEVDNAGELDSYKGQVILAAGQKVYVQASTDTDLRGLLVEVDAGGKAWNQVSGQVNAAQGNISLVGLAVNQDGRLSATTSVQANGSIRLLARDTVSVNASGVDVTVSATNAGAVRFGSASQTTVLPDATDTGTAVDAQLQPLSSVEVMGREIVMAGGSSIKVPGGGVSFTALPDPSVNVTSPLPVDPDSRVRLEAGSTIDVSGSVADVPVSRNLLQVELRTNELKDSPLQRSGALRGQKVTVDARVGTPLADVSGAIAGIQRGVAERTATGGTVSLNSQGDIVMAGGATINVSGGAVDYQPGTIATSQLITAGGQVVDIGKADPNVVYTGVANPTITVTDPRWGVTTTYTRAGFGSYDPGYVDGRNAGTVSFAARGLAINGTLLGNATGGLLQRTPATQPRGGTLIVGDPTGQGLKVPDFRAPAVSFTDVPVALDITPDQPLPADWQTLPLPTAYLHEGGFTRTQVYSNGAITLDGSLTLRPGSSLSLTGPVVNLGGQLNAPAGTVALTGVQVNPDAVLTGAAQPGVFLADGTTVTLNGVWVNDSPLLAGRNPATALYTNGGTFSASVSAPGGALLIGNDVSLHADAGAWLNSLGKLAGGNGGSISLNAGASRVAFGTGTGLDLSAAGFGAGGSLRLAVGRLRVSAGSAFGSAQLFDPVAAIPKPYVIGADLFGDGGFQNISLTATAGGYTDTLGNFVDPLVLAAGANLRPRLEVLTVLPGYASAAGTNDSSALLTKFLPPDWQRSGVSLSIAVQPNSIVLPGSAGDLVFADGASIAADPGSTVAFTSSSRVLLNGAISAPAGTVTAELDPPPGTLEGYDPTVGIYVGATGQISVSGTSVLQPSDIGLRKGNVLNGGSISLTALRGSVALAAGSVLDASGAVAPLDIPDAGGYVRRPVASAGGNIALLARENISLDGRLSLAAGVAPTGDPQPAGGSLSIGISSQRVPTPPPDFVNTFPVVPRQLVIGGPTAGTVDGTVRLDPAVIAVTGLANLTLQADDRIVFGQDLNLAIPNALALQAPNLIAGDGVAAVHLNVNTLALGPRLLNAPALAPATSGAATLMANANLIDLFGSLSLQGFGTTTLSSATDLRATGLALTNSGLLTGSLSAAGTLNLAAARIYPTTFSNYAVTVAPGDGGVLNLVATGRDSSTPLSGAGGIDLSAARISQGTALLAPLGQISLTATDALTLEQGSRTSVSAAGQLIPFGTVQSGTSWTYQAALGTVATVSAPPDKRISLSANNVAVAAGATVDVSGGGDLYAYEFVPGPGGSKDALSAAVTQGLYAVLPTLGTSPAPYDTQEYASSTLQPWNSVHLDGVAGLLAAGDYTLLPARYALLPGAVLVQAVAAARDLPAGSVSALSDGTPVVSGYAFFGGTTLRDSRTTGFAVRPGSYARQLAEYDDSLASAFFAKAAAANDQPVPLLPRDAGLLQVNVGDSLALDGALRAAAGSGGRGARVDVSASNLSIVAAGAAPVAGAVNVAADALNALGAESLLLGGTRTTDATVTTITLAAESVDVQAGATLAAPEVILAARNDISLETGSRIEARGATGAAAGPDQMLTLAGSPGGAVVRATTGAQAEVRRATPGTAGNITIGDGAVVTATGAVAVDAAGTARSFGTLDAGGGSLALGSGRIALGAEQADVADGLALSSAGLQSLAGLRELRLTGSRSVDFVGPVTLGTAGSATLGQLSINTPQLNGSGSDAALSATTVVIGNTGPAASSVPVQGSGSLTLAAQDLRFGAGSVGVSGFGTVNLDAARQIQGTDTFTLQSGGDLSLQAPLITGASGSTVSLQAPGRSVTLTSAPVPAPLAASTSQGVGASLEIAGGSVTVDTALAFQGGNIRLQAEQNLNLTDAAVLDTSGRDINIGSASVAIPAGDITLVARSGHVDLAAGAWLDLSAGVNGGRSGELDVYAGGVATLAGTLGGAAADADHSGRFRLYAGQGTGFAALNSSLNAGGFNRQREIEVGAGDITVAAGETVRAEEVVLAASGTTLDNGVARDSRVDVAGAIDARAAGGGSVTLAARGDVTVETGASINASSTSSSGGGGSILLSSTRGQLSVPTGADLDVSGGTRGGTVTLRAVSTTTGIAVPVLDTTTVRGADAIIMQPVVSATATTLDAAAISGLKEQFDTYMQSAPDAIAAAINPADPSIFLIRPELEVDSAGDLTLATTWDLLTWRYNNEPGLLTLRAAGNLNINGNLTDGVQQGGTSVTAMTGSSWSYVLAAGADAGSALAGATAGRRMDATAAGTLTVASGQSVRTGTGSIGLYADTDLVLASRNSLVYTTGVQALAPQKIGAGSSALTASWLRDGGDITLAAGRDIVGAQGAQILSGWDIRTGLQSGIARWAVDLGKFQQGVAALGGGNVTVNAGRDIDNLSVTIPTTGAERVAEPGMFDVFGGGDLSVSAGRNILSGVYSTWSGIGSLRAGGSIISGYSTSGHDLYTLLAFGNGSFDVGARRDVNLGGLLNPTAVQPALNPGSLDKPYFFTYAPTDALNVIAAAGDVDLFNDGGAFTAVVGQTVAGATRGFGVYPASVRVAAPGGDVTIAASMTLLPSPDGALELLAGGSLNAAGASVIMSDDNPASVASPAALSSTQNLLGTISDSALAVIHAGDTAPVRLVAAVGDVSGGSWRLPKAVDVEAARDARDVSIITQNVNPDDTSLISAGRDVRFSDVSNGLEVGGVGRVEVLAGRNVDLGFSAGIVTDGNARNPQLPTGSGADIEVWAGLPATLYVDDYVAVYLAPKKLSDGTEIPAPYAQTLVDFVQGKTGKAGLSPDDALAAFQHFTPDLQRELFVQVLFSELRAAGRNADFNRGAAAITSLIPDYADFISRDLDPASPNYFFSHLPAGFGAIRPYVQLSDYQQTLINYVSGLNIVGSPVSLTASEALAEFRSLPRQKQVPLLLELLSNDLRLASEITPIAGATAERIKGAAQGDPAAIALAALVEEVPAEVQQAALNSLFTDGGLVSGDLNLVFSQIYTLAGGDISLLVPGGGVNVGLANPPQNSTVAKRPSQLGIVAEGPGSVRIFANNDVLVNQSRVFTLQGGDILIWSTVGSIDAGRGAKSSISAPPPTITIDANGQLQVQFSDAISGSGIRGILTRNDIKPGDVDLDAPKGEINAGDAGIASAGNLNAFTPRFLNLDNIQFTTSTNVPQETSIASSLTGVSGLAASASQNATSGASAAAEKQAPMADAAMGWLEVFIEGFGDPDEQDEEKRKKKRGESSGT